MFTSVSVGEREIPVFSVSREGFPAPPNNKIRISSERDVEFLDSFLKTLVEGSLDPDELVFSGFDGGGVKRKQAISDTPNGHIWVVDETTWRNHLTHTATGTPEVYAERHATPCVGIYAKDQLKTATLEADLIGLNPQGQALAEIPSGTHIFDPVTHIDHPDTGVHQALSGLVFFEYQ